MSSLMQVLAILAGCAVCYAVARKSFFYNFEKPVAAIALNGLDLSWLVSLMCFVVLFCVQFGRFCTAQFIENETLGIFVYALVYQLVAIFCIFLFKKFSFAKIEFGVVFNLKILKTTLKYFVGGLFCALALGALVKATVFIFTGEIPKEQEVVELFKGTNDSLSILLAMFSFVTLAPIFEELFFRGILYCSLKGSMKRVLSVSLSREISAVVIALIFALSHSSAFAFIPLFMLSLVFTALYEKTRSILAPMVCHGLFNFVNAVVILICLK